MPTPAPAASAPSSADTLDLDGFGLDGRHPVASGKGDGFSPRDRKEKTGGRKGYCKFQLHLIIPEVGKIFTIPGSRQNPKMLWVYDTKVVRDRIAKFLPVFWDILAQEGERLVGEFPECGVTLVVRHMLVHPTNSTASSGPSAFSSFS